MRLAALTCVFAALAIGGCGGGDDNGAEDTSTTQSTQAPADTVTTKQDGGAAKAPGAPPQSQPGAQGGSGEGQAATPSTQQFIAAADMICAEAQRELAVSGQKIARSLSDLARKKASQDEYFRRTAALTEKAVAAAKQAIARIASLPRPGFRGDAFAAYLSSTREQASLLAQEVDAQRRGDAEAVSKLNVQIADATRKTQAAAREFGFHRCGGT
jgi:hypothetical protein